MPLETSEPADLAALTAGEDRPRRKSPKRAEREEAEEQARRLAYVGMLAAGLAHEIRSPLNAIQLNVQLLQEGLARLALAAEPRAGLGRNLERIEREVRFLQEALTEFLNYARPPRPEPVPTDLPAFVAEVLELHEPECRARAIELKREFAEGLFPVRIDQRQMAQVLTNLLNNAREAVGDHGRITVRVGEAADQEAVEIRVGDDGGGVPPSDAERVFEAWYSTKAHGAGLGLGIAKRIVEEHGGSLALENHPGVGATFVVRLPRAKVLEFHEGPGGPTPGGE
jgi:signal transduction histidine kinase